MLAEQRALVHVHHQAEHEGHADADAPRLVHVPEHQHQRQQVGHAPAWRPSGSMLSGSASSSVSPMKNGLTGSSSWSDRGA